MKVAFLSAGSSIHTVRWVNAMVEHGLDTILATQHVPDPAIDSRVRIIELPFKGMSGYFLNAPALRRALKEQGPDLVNAHYASGYGTTARLAGCRPLILSVWGSDVYDFPRTRIKRWLVKGNLTKANAVASTSQAMADQARKIAPKIKRMSITPFGVDLDRFKPLKSDDDESSTIVIGTVKTLMMKYGIDTLIDAFALLCSRIDPNQASRLRLRIVGGGPDSEALKERAISAGIWTITEFVGPVAHSEVPSELLKFDIYAALSRLDSESFGVAIVEAGACGLPVVVSDVGGLPEVVDHCVSGLVVPRENPEAAAEALETLVLNPALRARMGNAGRTRVSKLYDWQQNVQEMIELYKQIIKSTA